MALSGTYMLAAQAWRAVMVVLMMVLNIESTNTTIPTPVIRLTLADILRKLKPLLVKNGVEILDIMLTGGAASHIVNDVQTFTDLDVVFRVRQGNWTVTSRRILTAFTSCLRELGAGINVEDYICNKFKMDRVDKWSLISLHSSTTPIDFKFVASMRREYEFSTDSFEIPLYNARTETLEIGNVIWSHYASIQTAMEHLATRTCDILSPEDVFGGGFMKYCLLKTKGFRDAKNGESLALMIRVMVNKFYQDHVLNRPRVFPEPETALLRPFERYLRTHFTRSQGSEKVAFLEVIVRLISQYLNESAEKEKLLDLLKNLSDELRATAGAHVDEAVRNWLAWYRPFAIEGLQHPYRGQPNFHVL